jgi:hypothetical protein
MDEFAEPFMAQVVQIIARNPSLYQWQQKQEESKIIEQDLTKKDKLILHLDPILSRNLIVQLTS